ncbi:MAG: hypothetical protein GY928_31495 [Colwellia sp.]|nr:hypothetical protein [Colwellia sp.]
MEDFARFFQNFDNPLIDEDHLMELCLQHIDRCQYRIGVMPVDQNDFDDAGEN